jgi:hypothetical protein
MDDLIPVSEMSESEYEDFLHEGCIHPYCLWFPEEWKTIDEATEKLDKEDI